MPKHLRLARDPGKTGASRREAAQPSRSALRSRIPQEATLVSTSLSLPTTARTALHHQLSAHLELRAFLTVDGVVRVFDDQSVKVLRESIRM